MIRICIIGAGITGCAIARKLSGFEAEIVILEKENDVSKGSTKANSGIVHAGYGLKTGSLKSMLCVKGNSMFDKIDIELNFGFRRCGSLLIGFDREHDLAEITQLYNNGAANGVKGLEILDSHKLKEKEPEINPDAVCALYAPSAGVASPYEFAIALAENSIANGAELFLNTEVINIVREKKQYVIETASGIFRADVVINAAGLYSDIISAVAGFKYFRITPRRGQYLVFDRWTGKSLKHVIFQVPTSMGKGILATPTFHENLMTGPDAENIESRTDYSQGKEALVKILEVAAKSYPGIEKNKIIRAFTGIRSVSDRNDFIVESPAPGFINAAGIDSPGLTSAPAIAEMVRDMVRDYAGILHEKNYFNPGRDGIIKVREDLPAAEVQELINLPPDSPDRLVCRCEQVRQRVITDSLRRGIKVTTVDGVKRRTRAGMGRCQGGFCRSRVKELIAGEYSITPDTVGGPDREPLNIAFLKKEQ